MDFLALTFLQAPVWLWLGFFGVILGILLLDLGFLSRGDGAITLSRSIAMTCLIFSLSLMFAGWIYTTLGIAQAELFLSGLLVEQALSIDNVFVIAMIFSYFAIPPAHQHRVLLWGIFAAMLLRAAFIGVGSVLVMNFDWILWLFAGFLIVSAYKIFMEADTEPDIGNNAVVRFLCRHFRVTTDMQGGNFFIRKAGAEGTGFQRFATPVFLAFVTVNFADVIFAIDSVPAVLSLTPDIFIVYTSNIFAILGLRSLYFVINGLIARFIYLEHALAVLLMFLGGKIIWDRLVSPIDPAVTLAIIFAIIVLALATSTFQRKRIKRREARKEARKEARPV